MALRSNPSTKLGIGQELQGIRRLWVIAPRGSLLKAGARRRHLILHRQRKKRGSDGTYMNCLLSVYRRLIDIRVMPVHNPQSRNPNIRPWMGLLAITYWSQLARPIRDSFNDSPLHNLSCAVLRIPNRPIGICGSINSGGIRIFSLGRLGRICDRLPLDEQIIGVAFTMLAMSACNKADI